MNQENFNIPEQPDTPPQITKEHHAGQQGVPPDVREVPVREFKETTLTEAMDQGRLGLIKDPTLTDEDEPSYLGVPIDTSTLNLTAEEIEEIEARRAKAERGNSFMNFLKKPVGKAVAILAGLAIVGSAVGVGVKVGAGSEQTNTPPAPDDKVTSGPEVPGVVPPVVVETVPAPTPEVTTPAPEQTPSPEAGVSTGKAAEFNMTDAEYQQIVDSLKIDLASHSTPESAVAALNEKMTLYFNGGQTKEEYEKYYQWSVPDKSPGWNSWANKVYTSAILESMFTSNYTDVEGSYIQKMVDLKREANRLWANSTKSESQPSYEMAFNFVPTGDINSFDTGWIDATGELTYTDNAQENSETATDSHAIGSYTFSNAKITMKPNTETNTWQVTQIMSAN